jgi:hypothetical protein
LNNLRTKRTGDRVVSRSMDQDDKEYFRNRAMQELERVHAGGHPAAVRSHYEMATHYLDQAAHRPRLR